MIFGYCEKCGKELSEGVSFITKTDVINHQIQNIKYCTGCAMLYVDGGLLRGEVKPLEMRMPSTHVETGNGYGRE